MLTLRIQPDFEGPSLQEMFSLIADSDAPVVEVKWENTRTEVALLSRIRQKRVTLVVRDLAAMERTASAVGASLIFEPGLKVSAYQALFSNQSSINWRSLVTEIGTGVSRGVLMGVIGDFARKGNSTKQLRAVMNDCLFEGVSPFDADVLVGLRARM